MIVRGLTGEVRYGYRVVASLGPWTRDDTRVDTVARDLDEFWLEQATRLDLRLSLGRRAWEWRGVEIVDPSRDSFVVRVHGSPTLL